MRDLYIISFGDSSSYRYYDGEDDRMGAKTENDIRSFLCQKFPELRSGAFLEKAEIRRVPFEEQDRYMG